MDGQVEKICELAKKLCERRAYQEAWDALYTVYKYTDDEDVLSIMAEYLYVPNKVRYLDNYEKNISFFEEKRLKIFGYTAADDFNSKENGIKILWKDDVKHILYYLGTREETEDIHWELRKQEIPEGRINTITEEKHILAVNIIPSWLSGNDKNQVIL